MPRTVAPAVAPGIMSSIRQPTIAIDDELTLRPFRLTDVDRVIEAFDDPDIRHWHARHLDSVLQARQWIGYCHLLWLQEKCANFAVADTADRVLGRVAMYTELVGGTGEIGYWVLPDARGRGVAARAGAAVTRWGHEALDLHRIVLEHAVGNLASCGVAHALGYDLEGVARSLHLLADGRHDVHVHAHVRTDLPTVAAVE